MDWDIRIREFLQALVSAAPPSPYRNPYHQRHTVHNLHLFLTRRDRLARTVFLVGEAPGHRGAAISGVPFTSSAILEREWNDPWGAFGPDLGYQIPGEVTYATEATATMVWRGLSETCSDLPLPLTWNAIPFHPVGGTPDSNSSVRRGDLHFGQSYLEWMLDFAPNATVVGVGRAAQTALAEMGHQAHAVRHPSRGGKAAFLEGIVGVKSQLSD
ncbi:MAG: hypothetical protein HOH95_11615 [Dehalococcoidia bacterium]|nr:hypothetical protein [Chloroflexota bacterium]MBT5775011.1 hypothetical protein [Dehalococcoidia bacterium]